MGTGLKVGLKNSGQSALSYVVEHPSEFVSQNKHWYSGALRMVPVVAGMVSLVPGVAAAASAWAAANPIVKALGAVGGLAGTVAAIRDAARPITTIVEEVFPAPDPEPLPAPPDEIPEPAPDPIPDPISPPVDTPPERIIDYTLPLGVGNLGGVPMPNFGMLPTGVTAAVGQMTPASRIAAKLSGRRGGRKSARKRRKKSAATGVRRRKRSIAKGNLFKKGSPAAKAWGKKMRALRKKKRK